VTDTTTTPSLLEEKLLEFLLKFENRRKFYKIPGAALGIVTSNRTLVSQGFGFRNLEDKTLVTTRTLFALGSMTKSLTALFIATQVDENKYTWDTLVKDISRNYQFPEPINNTMRVRDLLGMNTGIDGALNPYASMDMKLYGSNATLWNDQSAVYTIRGIPLLPFLQQDIHTYKYNNELFASAGYLTPLKEGKPTSQLLEIYQQLMRKKVFLPLGMRESHITGVLSSISDNFAPSYGLDMSGGEDKTFVDGPVSINYIDGIAPAGQGVSNIEDINRYLITLLNNGVTPEGTRIVNAETLQELWSTKGKTTTTKTTDAGITGTTTYGMGWWIEKVPRKNSSEPLTIHHHGGFLPSWSCMHLIIPEKNIGMAVLSNGCFGREFSMEMCQELIKLVDEADETKFINNEALYTKFVQDLRTTIPTLVSSYKGDPEKISHLIGNYEGGWTLEIEADNDLLLFKNGWVYHLYPSKENPDYLFYIGASNNHRVMRVAKNKKGENDMESAKVWFATDEQNNILMLGPQIGVVKKLPNLINSPHIYAKTFTVLTGKKVTHPPIEESDISFSPNSFLEEEILLPKIENVEINVSGETTRYLLENLQLD
jgi:CubicO group peptidase (beta-lactamase class C family)